MTEIEEERLFTALSEIADIFGYEIVRRDPGPCEVQLAEGESCTREAGHTGFHRIEGQVLILEHWARLGGVVAGDERFGQIQ